MPKIIDIIQHRNKYSVQTFIVLDEMPDIKYERVGDLLIGEDSGFFNFYGYNRPTKTCQAFAGREFAIPLTNGEVEKASGQWWDHFPSDYSDLVYSLGAGTHDGLGKCNVFSSIKVDKELVDDWVDKNEPSNNYYKYDVRHKDYGAHRIVSRFDAV